MPSTPYAVTPDVDCIIEKYWSNRDIKTTTPQFSHNMNLLQKELIEHYYPIMDNDSRKRADNSLKMLNIKINNYSNIQTKPKKSSDKNLDLDISFNEETATKLIEVLDSTLMVEPLTNLKPTRSRGLGGRSTKNMSDVP